MMYLGVDLGTSGVKLILMQADGTVVASTSRQYPVSYPKPGWSEQNPEDWYTATMDGIRALLEGQDPSQVGGIGVGGQMHGLVLLDSADQVIRPAILWNDGRTEEEVAYLNETIGRSRLSACTANIAFAGFTAPKILWVKKHEPDNYARIAKIMLPKDYLVYRMTGVHATDLSDASGTLLLDVAHRCWSKEMCEICGVNPAWLPRLFESYEAVGTLRPELQQQLGLSQVILAAGAGDNAAAAVGTGTVGDGACNISLGTSGTVFISDSRFGVDDTNALHAFCHADGHWHLMGCMLSAASCVGWWMKTLQSEDFDAEMAGLDAKLGKNNVLFLPYLMGERSPLNDVNARGTFTGMTMDTTRGDLMLAVLEGVAFGLRDSVEVARKLGREIRTSKVCGGGAKNRLWLRILANVLNLDLELPAVEEGPSMGGAMLAAVACGEYPDVRAAADAIVRVRQTIHPEPALVAAYEKRYRMFRKLYPALKGSFAEMARMEE